jgi:signal transduction histidine kinase
VFAAVAEEVARVLAAELAVIGRYDDGVVTMVGDWRRAGDPIYSGRTIALGGRNVGTVVFETGRPARLDDYAEAFGDVATAAREGDVRSSVGAPITVAGRLWGVMVASSSHANAFPVAAEQRLVEFTELVATAIANAEAQAEVAASRARIVATADETRRRIERDLHDGAQQRLVSLELQLRTARAAVPPELAELAAELDRVANGLTNALDELREFARGIHPAVLTEGGLAAALKMLARRSVVPVALDVRVDGRLPEPVEVGAYFIVSEALTNAAKHGQAAAASVDVEVVGEVLCVSVRDDGIGGASFVAGSGLAGLKDRVEALGGRISLESPPGAGTRIDVRLPLRPVAVE